jgi:hypothetical protein
MIITGCGPSPAGRRRMPTSREPSNGISIRRPGGSRNGSASVRQATARMCAARIWPGSLTNRNFAKW